MDTVAQETNHPQPLSLGAKVALTILSVLLLCGLFFLPVLTTRAEVDAGNVSKNSLVGKPGAQILFGHIAQTSTLTTTLTFTPTSTETLTATPTETATTAPTRTATPTKTGTLPTSTLTATPTVTGTLSPNPSLVVKVKPTEAYIGQKFTFDIIIGNSGTGPLTEVVIADSFPSYILIEAVASQRGVVNRSQHSFTVSVGSVYPGESINITALVRVTSNATATETITNIVTMTYYPSKSRTASVSYKVIASALPGTGGLPLVRQDMPPFRSTDLTQSLLTALLGVILLIYTLWARKQGERSPGWMSIIAGILLLLALISGLSATGILGSTQQGQLADLPEPQPEVVDSLEAQVQRPRAVDFATPEPLPAITLPVYPIPSPEVLITPAPGESQPDTSAISRIVIPYLLLDTDVAYIPFDGNTWLIGGLTQEVAWLGDTSWPGLGSNTGLAGHVTVTGQGDGPFRYLDELPVGELVILYTEENMYSYRVREHALVGYDQLEVTHATQNPQITMITCANWNDETQIWLDRLIVYADLVRTEPLDRTESY